MVNRLGSSFAEAVDIIDLQESVFSAKIKREKLDLFDKAIAAKNRNILKQSKNIKNEKLCCFNHSKFYIKESLEANKSFSKEVLEEVFNANCFMEYFSYKINHSKYKDIKGFPVEEDIIHLDFKCRKCERSTSFGFEPRQLQEETNNMIDKSFLDA